jgi:hypothetical protein
MENTAACEASVRLSNLNKGWDHPVHRIRLHSAAAVRTLHARLVTQHTPSSSPTAPLQCLPTWWHGPTLPASWVGRDEAHHKVLVLEGCSCDSLRVGTLRKSTLAAHLCKHHMQWVSYKINEKSQKINEKSTDGSLQAEDGKP